MSLKFNTTKLAFLALLLSSVIWGATGPIMKLTLVYVPTFTLALLRFGIATILLFPFVKHRFVQYKHSSNSPLLLFSSLCAVTFNITFFFWAVKLTSALNVGIIGAIVPILTLLLAHFVLSEHMSKNLLIGAIVGFLGIGIIVGKDLNVMTSTLTLSPLGDFFMFLAVLSFVASEIANKKLLTTFDPLFVTFHAFATGAFTFILPALYENVQNPYWISHLTSFTLFGILYGIFFSSLAAYYLWHFGLSRIDASKVGIFFYLDPIVGTTVAVWLLSETITLPFLIGSLFIFIGLFFAEVHFYQHTTSHIKTHWK